MNEEKKIQLNLAIPERYRDLLRRMAAERVMENPGQVVTGASIATEILLTALKEIAGENNEGGNKNELIHLSTKTVLSARRWISSTKYLSQHSLVNGAALRSGHLNRQ
jgi:hypothetical protein